MSSKLQQIRDRVAAVDHFSLRSDEGAPPEELDDESYTRNPPHLDGVPDMSSLIYLEVPNVVHNLDVRYGKDQIYTRVQSILIAVNPYKAVPLYDEGTMDGYRGAARGALAAAQPHCFAMAEEAYQTMSRTHVNQSVVICGESGSGKTESAKVFMKYLAHVTGHIQQSGSGPSIEDRFLQVNPVLESLGNAQTNMNNNSSRFGKFTKVLFEKKGEAPISLAAHQRPKSLPRPPIAGSFVETYLLEKSRVVHQDKGERNYHVFYQIIQGMDQKTKDEFVIADLPSPVDVMKTFHYLNQSGQYEIDGVSDADRFKRLCVALGDLGFDAAKQKDLFSALIGLLHMGNIPFNEVSADECNITGGAEKATLAIAARLFGITEDALNKRLTTRGIKVGMQTITKPYSVEDAVHNRDAVTKAMYQALFKYVVQQINEQLYTKPSAGAPDPLYIGILDVFGFECTDWNNSFEQFCINFANERLQRFFNHHVVLSEQDEYLREGLPWTPLEIRDNQDTIDLIQSSPNGIIAVLDSACVQPKGSDDIFLRNLFNVQRRNPRLKQTRTRKASVSTLAPQKMQEEKQAAVKKANRREKFAGFIVDHYAAKVCYNVDGFLAKNTDSLHPDTYDCFSKSSGPVISAVLRPPETQGRRRSTGSFHSVGSAFKKQLEALMKTLMSTDPHFVRCLNPNQFKMPSAFDKDYITPQLIYGGLIGALRILKLGFPSRCRYDTIYERYGHVIPAIKKKQEAKEGVSAAVQKEFSEAVFLAFGLELDAYKLGLTKVFFRPGKQEWLENVLGAGELDATMIAKVRKMMFQQRFRRLRAGLLLVVRAQMWVNKRRVFHNLTRAVGKINVLGRIVAGPLAKIKKRRAIRTLQAAFRTAQSTMALNKASQAAAALQRYGTHMLARLAIRTRLETSIQGRRDKRAVAAKSIQKLLRAQHRKATMTAALDERVKATRERKAHTSKQQEEERKKQLEAERARLEQEEKQRQETEEKQRLAALAAHSEKLSAEQKRRKEEELKAREARKQADENERKKQEEEERIAKELAAAQLKEAEEKERIKAQKKAKELAWRQTEQQRAAAKEQARLQRLEKEEKERQIREEQKRVERELEATERVQDRLAEEYEEREIIANAERAASPDGKDGGTDGAKRRYSIPAHILAAHMAEKKRQAVERAEEHARRMRHVLLTGGKFLKHGRKGKPHIKYVCINVLGNLHWSDKPMDPRKLLPSNSYIKLKNVLHVIPGKETAVLKRKWAKDAPEMLCLSVVSTERTLDLQAVNVKERDLWIKAIESAVNDANNNVVDFITGAKQTDVRGPKGKAGAGGKAVLKRSATLNPSQIKQFKQEAQQQGQGGEDSSLQDFRRTPVPTMHTFKDETEMKDFVAKGGEFLKFGRQGKPQIVYVDGDVERLFWGPHAKPSLRQGSKFVLLKDVESVRAGKVTGVFQYRSTDALSPPENCFSLIFKSWTLDLQVETNEMRNNWVAALHTMVEKAKAKWIAQHGRPGGKSKQRLVRSQSLRLTNAKSGRQALPTAWRVPEQPAFPQSISESSIAEES